MASFHQFIPTIVIKPNVFPTPSLKHKIKCLRSLKKRYSRSPTSYIKDRIKAAEFEIAEESLAAHSTYESKL